MLVDDNECEPPHRSFRKACEAFYSYGSIEPLQDSGLAVVPMQLLSYGRPAYLQMIWRSSTHAFNQVTLVLKKHDNQIMLAEAVRTRFSDDSSSAARTSARSRGQFQGRKHAGLCSWPLPWNVTQPDSPHHTISRHQNPRKVRNSILSSRQYFSCILQPAALLQKSTAPICKFAAFMADLQLEPPL